MGINYVKNLLSKNSNSGIVVEPRLKSRFEDGNNIAHSQESTQDFKTASISFYNESGTEIPNIQSKSNQRENIEKVISKTSITNVENIDQSKTLQKNGKGLIFLKQTLVEKNVNSGKPIPLNAIDGFQKEQENHSSHDFKIESKTYGLLNKPQEKTFIHKDTFNDKNNMDVLEDKLNTYQQASVKISIGSIEVKAIKQPQKKQVEHKAKPSLKLSLEDYIEKRK